MAIYTDEQIIRYFSHIGYSGSLEDAHQLVVSRPLDLLKTIQVLHMSKVPFESVSLHYSTHRTLSLDADDLFDKVVGQGRGGYCMEVNRFFAAVLKSLGYKLTSVGGRVNGPEGYKGWDHMLNLVKIDNKRYLVDVGFGSNTAPYPVPLEHDYEFVAIAPAKGRLQYRTIDQLTDPDQKLWVFSVKPDDNTPWRDAYVFVEIEFIPGDYEVMNLRTMTSPRSFFVQSVMCMRTILDDDTKEKKPVGKMILHRDYVKKTHGEKEEIIKKFESEKDRVEALKEHFGIVLSEKEQNAIRGLASELKDTSRHA